MADDETPEETAASADADAVEEPAGAESSETAASAGADAVEESAGADAAEPEEKLHPKQARKRARSRAGGPAKPARSIEERQAERLALRKAKAVARTRRRGQEKAKKKAAGTSAAPTPAAERVEGNPLVRRGTVVSAKPDKTITVRIDTARRHRRYEKIVRSSTTLHAHDEANDANEGDVVQIVECRPLSRLKRWKLVEVLERAK
jgi:small subunit ribosomal protein S17